MCRAPSLPQSFLQLSNLALHTNQTMPKLQAALNFFSISAAFSHLSGIQSDTRVSRPAYQ